MVESSPGKAGVGGSIPSLATMKSTSCTSYPIPFRSKTLLHPFNNHFPRSPGYPDRPATGQSKKCTSIGGVILTNLGVPANSTMGYATGDLKGAVGVTILNTESTAPRLSCTCSIIWVSESGDIIDLRINNATF